MWLKDQRISPTIFNQSAARPSYDLFGFPEKRSFSLTALRFPRCSDHLVAKTKTINDFWNWASSPSTILKNQCGCRSLDYLPPEILAVSLEKPLECNRNRWLPSDQSPRNRNCNSEVSWSSFHLRSERGFFRGRRGHHSGLRCMRVSTHRVYILSYKPKLVVLFFARKNFYERMRQPRQEKMSTQYSILSELRIRSKLCSALTSNFVQVWSAIVLILHATALSDNLRIRWPSEDELRACQSQKRGKDIEINRLHGGV